MKRLLVLAVLVLAPTASAHEPMGSPVKLGYVSTVSNVDPLILGLDARVLGGQDKLFVRNWSRKRVTLFERDGTPIVLKPGASRSWHDHRIGWFLPDPPKLVQDQPDRPHLLRNWQIPGRTGGRAFVIKGLLGYAPPPAAKAETGDRGWILPLGLAAAAVAIAAAVGVGVRRARRRTPELP